MELTCPKCHGAMRSYERSGILIDQCTECRGVFLDRGELDKLIDAEAAHGQAAPATAAAAPWGSLPARQYDDDRYRGDQQSHQEERYRGSDHYRGDDDRYGKKRKKSFFEELFD